MLYPRDATFDFHVAKHFSFLYFQYVHIHCHRPRDSRVVGLSQIRIMGASLHGVESGGAQERHHLKGQSARERFVMLRCPLWSD